MTTTNDDYLWDRSAPVDPDVARLEELLGRFGHRAPLPVAGQVSGRPASTPRARPWLALVAGIAAALLLVALPFGRASGYRVEGVEGLARVFVGDRLEVSGSVATLFLPSMGTVDVEPGSRVEVVSTGARGDAHALRLERGTLRASILAEPRRFQIDTPAGLTIDLGCEYSLRVLDDGVSELQVWTGQVAFAYEGREVYVPAGAACRSLPGRGPTPPVFLDAAPERVAAVERFVAGSASEADLELLLDLASFDDALPLFALLTGPDVPRAWKVRIEERMRRHFHLPADVEVPVEELFAGDPGAREAWLAELRPYWARGMFTKKGVRKGD